MLYTMHIDKEILWKYTMEEIPRDFQILFYLCKNFWHDQQDLRKNCNFLYWVVLTHLTVNKDKFEKERWKLIDFF